MSSLEPPLRSSSAHIWPALDPQNELPPLDLPADDAAAMHAVSTLRNRSLTSPGLPADTDAMAIDRRVARAGVYAEQRYQRGLKSWRRRANPLLAMLCGPFIVVGFVVLLVDRHLLAWAAGAVCGAAVTMWVAFRETPPRYVEQWRDGAEGECKTEKALQPLEKAGWTVVHDIQQRYGNYDHIAVGPNGVYLLDSKNLEGVVEIKDGTPHLNRRHDPEADKPIASIPKQALGAAASVKEDIQRRTEHRLWVQAVVVFWSEFPEQLVEADPCVYIHGTCLEAWLAQRPEQLNPARVHEITAAILHLAEESEGPSVRLAH